MSKGLILPEHVEAQVNKKKFDKEMAARDEAVERGDQIQVNMLVSPSHNDPDKFAAVIMYDGFVTEKAAGDFLISQQAAMRGNRKERRAHEKKAKK